MTGFLTGIASRLAPHAAASILAIHPATLHAQNEPDQTTPDQEDPVAGFSEVRITPSPHLENAVSRSPTEMSWQELSSAITVSNDSGATRRVIVAAAIVCDGAYICAEVRSRAFALRPKTPVPVSSRISDPAGFPKRVVLSRDGLDINRPSRAVLTRNGFDSEGLLATWSSRKPSNDKPYAIFVVAPSHSPTSSAAGIGILLDRATPIIR